MNFIGTGQVEHSSLVKMVTLIMSLKDSICITVRLAKLSLSRAINLISCSVSKMKIEKKL